MDALCDIQLCTAWTLDADLGEAQAADCAKHREILGIFVANDVKKECKDGKQVN